MTHEVKISPEWVEDNPELVARWLELLVIAIEPYAEEPTAYMDDYPCHKGICSKEKCTRCGKAIRAQEALHYAKPNT